MFPGFTFALSCVARSESLLLWINIQMFINVVPLSLVILHLKAEVVLFSGACHLHWYMFVMIIVCQQP
jgi:hypothetical protein